MNSICRTELSLKVGAIGADAEGLEVRVAGPGPIRIELQATESARRGGCRRPRRVDVDIVRCPGDFRPQSWRDVPEGTCRVVQVAHRTARRRRDAVAYVRAFNRSALEQASGLWALVRSARNRGRFV